MSWAIVAASVASAAAGMYGASEASKAAAKGNAQASALQQNALLATLQLGDPARAMGYQAMGDLSHLYGYKQAPWSSLQDLQKTITGQYGGLGAGGGGTAQPPDGRGTGTKLMQLDPAYYAADALGLGDNYQKLLGGFGVDPFGFFNDKPEPYKVNKDGTISINGAKGGKKQISGTIDPRTGVFTAIKDPGNNAEAINKYLQTGEGLDALPSSAKRAVMAIDALKKAGWDYGKLQESRNNAGFDPTAAPDGSIPSVPGGENVAGNFSRFFTSPDYVFRQDQGVKALDAGAAARGGVLSGQRLKAGVDFSGNLASSEYGNYVNRLMQMAGLGTAATTNAQSAVSNTGQTLSQLAQDTGTARASGIMGMGNSAMNSINSGINAYTIQDYLKSQKLSGNSFLMDDRYDPPIG